LEKSANFLLGASVLSWGVMGLAQVDLAHFASPVRWCIFLLNLTVAVAFWIRQPVRISGSLADLTLCLPSFLICGLAFGLTPPTVGWPILAEIVFALGTFAALWSLICLGRCFAIFPAVRGTAVKGPYRYIRHPAYAGEAVMVLGCLFANPSPLPALVFAAMLPCLVVRIAAEERLMQTQPAYRRYCRAVQWRLMPGLW